jgi:signal peptidase I
MKKTIQIGAKIIEWSLFLALIVIFFIVISPLLPTKDYLATYVVSTGSMEPNLPAGSIIFTQKIEPSAITLGDIIAFTSPQSTDQTIVHRVATILKEGESIGFITKGDRNQSADPWTVYGTHVKGKTVYYLPYLGHLINYLKTPQGFILGLGIPTLFIIALEIKKIREGIKEEIDRKTKEHLEKFKLPLTAFILGLISLTLLSIKPVYALFSDSVTLEGITLSVGTWTDLEPAVGSVIINEVMWMGSTTSPFDEWIELYNTTDQDIDISNWDLEAGVLGRAGHFEIPAKNIIKAKSYFLITNYKTNHKNSALNVEGDLTNASLHLQDDYRVNGPLILKTKSGIIIDQTPETGLSTWPAGLLETGIRVSMQRTEAGDWDHCTHEECNSGNYWKTSSGGNYGTPGSENKFNGPELITGIDQSTLTVKVLGACKFESATYDLTYTTASVPMQVSGTVNLKDNCDFELPPLELGTCSDTVCVYHQRIEDMLIRIILKNNTHSRILEKKID